MMNIEEGDDSSWLGWPSSSTDRQSESGRIAIGEDIISDNDSSSNSFSDEEDDLILDTRRAIEEFDDMLAENDSKDLDESHHHAPLISGNTQASSDLPVQQQPQRGPRRLLSASLHSEIDAGQVRIHVEKHQQRNAASSAPTQTQSNMTQEELRALARKTGAAVAGGSLLAIGVPLLPLPGPGGEAMCIGGMAVLAKEFPAAQRVLDGTRDKLVEVLDKTAPAQEEEGRCC